MQSTVLYWIQLIDIYGVPVRLTINSYPKSKTIFGGVLTVISLVGITVFAFFSAQDFYLKQNPTVTRTTLSNDEVIDLQLDDKNFPFAIQVGNFTEINIESHYYYGNKEKITFNLTECRQSNFGNLIDNTVFDKAISTNAKCVPNLNHTIKSDFLNSEKVYFEFIFWIKNCEEADCPNPNKGSDDEKNKDNLLSLKMINLEVDVDNLKSPKKYFVEEISMEFSEGLTKTMEVFVKNEEIYTDDGWFMKSHNRDTGISFDHYYIDFLNRDKDSNEENVIAAVIKIFSSNKTMVTKRTYLKLQNAIANVGGILSIILTLMPLINLAFSQTKLDETILNTLYDFDYSDKVQNVELPEIKKKEQKRISNLSIIPKSPSTSTNDVSAIGVLKDANEIKKEEKTLNEKIKKIIDVKNGKNRKKLEFTFWEVLFGCCCGSKELKIKKALYEKSHGVVKKQMEISSIISKLDELDKIQYAIFSKEQTALFRCISRNLYSLDDYKMIKNPMNKVRTQFNDEYTMALTYLTYKDTLNNGGRLRTRIDDRLLDLLNEDLKSFTTSNKKEEENSDQPSPP